MRREFFSRWKNDSALEGNQVEIQNQRDRASTARKTVFNNNNNSNTTLGSIVVDQGWVQYYPTSINYIILLGYNWIHVNLEGGDDDV